MSSLVTVILGAATLSVVWGAALKHHVLTVSEKGAVFNQTTEIDVDNKVIYIHVPAHRDLPESRVMYEYTTGRALRCNPSINTCYLSNFDTRAFPGASEEEDDFEKLEALGISPSIMEMLEGNVQEDMVVAEKIDNLFILTKRMREAVGDYALYRVEPLPKDAMILEGTVDPKQKRVKRQAFIDMSCRYGQLPRQVYARTLPHCNRMVLCDNPTTNCRPYHHSGSDFFVCLCCPDEMVLEKCRCFHL